MGEFDPKRARTKRPMPLWIDAFQRDTGHFEADETGAYFNILMAMWSSPDLSLPDDPRRLARAARVSLRLWNSRIGEVIYPLLMKSDEGVTQKRLRREATYTERQVTQQSNRKNGFNSYNPLETLDVGQSTDTTMDTSGEQPTQLPNYPSNTQPNGCDADRVVSTFDFTKEVFDRGVAFLGKFGTGERQARSLIGKWRKEAGDAATYEAMGAASKAGVTDPVSWITKRLQPKGAPAHVPDFDLNDFDEETIQ